MRPKSVPPAQAADLLMAELCHNLADRFPTYPRVVIVNEVLRAYEATKLFGLSGEDQQQMMLQVATQQLGQRNGEIVVKARLDPEVHHRRMGAVAKPASEPGTSDIDVA
ncbi:MAG TPA: hypothetical protein VME70_10615 [Mycobacteriales bacterium]|nr:hypothetical protein [Mycobacteriales bacterium]